MAAESAKALVIVGSGLLVGMAAVVGVMPRTSLSSPLVYVAYAFIFISIFSGIVWINDIARATTSSTGNALRSPPALIAVCAFIIGLGTFSLYVLWNNASGNSHDLLSPDTTRQQVHWLLGFFALIVIGVFVGLFLRWRDKQRQSKEAEPPSRSA